MTDIIAAQYSLSRLEDLVAKQLPFDLSYGDGSPPPRKAGEDLRYFPLDLSAVKLTARRKTERLVIHALDTPKSWPFDIREIDRWHRKERGWACIGYHYIIDRAGLVVPGRPLDVIGAHTVGWNSTSVAIALAGGKGAKKDDLFSDHYTVAQGAMLWAMVYSFNRLWRNIAVVGHNDHPKVTKACPGFNVEDWLDGQG